MVNSNHQRHISRACLRQDSSLSLCMQNSDFSSFLHQTLRGFVGLVCYFLPKFLRVQVFRGKLPAAGALYRTRKHEGWYAYASDTHPSIKVGTILALDKLRKKIFCHSTCTYTGAWSFLPWQCSLIGIVFVVRKLTYSKQEGPDFCFSKHGSSRTKIPITRTPAIHWSARWSFTNCGSEIDHDG